MVISYSWEVFDMHRLLRSAWFLAALMVVIAPASHAHAGRFRRGCQPCCHEVRADNYTCYITRLYTIGPHEHMYYAVYYEINCETDPQSVYAIGGDSLGTTQE